MTKIENILILFVILNLLISSIGIATATEAQNPIKIEVVSYKIGDMVIETTSYTKENIAFMEPKIVIAPCGAKFTMSEALGRPRARLMPELNNQPIIKIESELSEDKKNQKIKLKINLWNIGSVKAKDINATMVSAPTAKVLYVKAGNTSAEEAIWTGEIEAWRSQEIVYEFLYLGNATENFTIPLTISGSGSDDEWYLNLSFHISESRLSNDAESRTKIPEVNPTPGFEIVSGLSSLIIISYLIKIKKKLS
jgi:hypothetical protein